MRDSDLTKKTKESSWRLMAVPYNKIWKFFCIKDTRQLTNTQLELRSSNAIKVRLQSSHFRLWLLCHPVIRALTFGVW